VLAVFMVISWCSNRLIEVLYAVVISLLILGGNSSSVIYS